MNTDNMISVASALVALIACISASLSYIVQRKSAKETILAQIRIGARTSRANVVSANRQKWIDAIRDDLTELLVSGAERANVKRRVDTASKMGDLTDELRKELTRREYELIRLISFSQTRISLRLNHNEQDHLVLIDAMREYELSYSPGTRTSLENVSRRIFKAEWTRLKNEASGIDPFVKEAKGDPATQLQNERSIKGWWRKLQRSQ